MEKDLLYQTISSINNQIYVQNFLGPAESNLLYQANKVINSQIFAHTFISLTEKDLISSVKIIAKFIHMIIYTHHKQIFYFKLVLTVFSMYSHKICQNL